MLRYLNMFVIIGVALIGISILGFATHNHFLTEPGQADNAYSSLAYLGAGVLMLVNGVVSIRNMPKVVSPTPAPRAEREGSGPQETTLSS